MAATTVPTSTATTIQTTSTAATILPDTSVAFIHTFPDIANIAAVTPVPILPNTDTPETTKTAHVKSEKDDESKEDILGHPGVIASLFILPLIAVCVGAALLILKACMLRGTARRKR